MHTGSTESNVLRNPAIHFLLTHQGEHLSHDRIHLVRRCTEHLQQQYGATITTANVIALQALGEIEARGCNAYVDMNHSTSFAVFVIDPMSGRRFTFTSADLIRLARDHVSGPLHAMS